mgnify:CR=1 FL=1
MARQNQTIASLFDAGDDAVFDWAAAAPIAMACMNMANDSGLTEMVLAGPAPLEDLARRIGAPPDKLRRVVNYLAAHGLLAVGADGTVSATPHTASMRRYAAALKINIVRTIAGSHLLDGLQQGVTPFEAAYGRSVFAHLAAEPELGAVFADYMGFMTDRVLAFLHADHPFAPFETAVDVGGSFGALLLSVLEHYPGTRGILFDLPNVLAQAEPRIRASQFSDRVALVAGDFFETAPPADLYLIKQILHDWEDADCVRILAAIRKSIAPGGRIAVIDHLLEEPPTPGEALSTDIGMMIWSPGRERTQKDFEALFADSGFRLGRVTPNPNGHSVIEAAPA